MIATPPFGLCRRLSECGFTGQALGDPTPGTGIPPTRVPGLVFVPSFVALFPLIVAQTSPIHP